MIDHALNMNVFIAHRRFGIGLLLSNVPCKQVCELDIIFNFEKAYFMLDEFILGGEVQDSSKKTILNAIAQMDILQEVQFVLINLIRISRHKYSDSLEILFKVSVHRWSWDNWYF